jgi:hypothetical protein
MQNYAERRRTMKDHVCKHYQKCPRQECQHAHAHEPDPDVTPGDEEDCLHVDCPEASAPKGTKCRKIKPSEDLIIGY